MGPRISQCARKPARRTHELWVFNWSGIGLNGRVLVAKIVTFYPFSFFEVYWFGQF